MSVQPWQVGGKEHGGGVDERIGGGMSGEEGGGSDAHLLLGFRGRRAAELPYAVAFRGRSRRPQKNFERPEDFPQFRKSRASKYLEAAVSQVPLRNQEQMSVRVWQAGGVERGRWSGRKIGGGATGTGRRSSNARLFEGRKPGQRHRRRPRGASFALKSRDEARIHEARGAAPAASRRFSLRPMLFGS